LIHLFFIQSNNKLNKYYYYASYFKYLNVLDCDVSILHRLLNVYFERISK